MTSKRFAASLAAALLALGLAGCSAASPEVAVGPVPLQPDVGGSSAVAEGSLADSGDLTRLGAETSQPSAVRSIARTANVTMTVTSARAAAQEIGALAERLGGSVTAQTLTGEGGTVFAGDIGIKVPTDKLDDAIAELGKLGNITSEQRSSDDITEMHVDLKARVAALEASVDRLTQLMEQSATTSELIEAETALSARQQELDGLRAQLESVEGQVTEASIWVSFGEASALPGGGPRTFWDALQASFSSIGTFFIGAFIALGFALPWLVLAALIALAIIIPIRRRRRARATPPAEKPLSADSTESVAEPDAP